MHRKKLIAVLLACAATAAAECRIEFLRDGSAALENEQIRVLAGNRVGADQGLFGWVFKPTGHEMIDVLYGQTDYVEGHVLGERWDPVEFRGFQGGAPGTGSLYVPKAAGTAADGSAAALVQTAEGAYRLTRTIIMRRGLATLELRYALENLDGEQKAFSLRFHTAMSPGARGPRQRKDDTIYLAATSGVLKLDQSLSGEAYHRAYGNDKFFYPRWEDEPKRAWVWGKLGTPALAGNWAAQVNRTHGDGMVLLAEPDGLLGFYNCPGITLEPVMAAAAPIPGETWRTTVYIGSFSGARDRAVTDANPLFLAAADGALIPLFAGTLRVHAQDGAVLFEAAARPTQAVAVPSEPWAARAGVVALDQTGKEIGRVDADGVCSLAEPNVVFEQRDKPAVAATVYEPEGLARAVARFLAERDFVVHVAAGASADERSRAEAIARRLGVGVCLTACRGKMLAVGTPRTNPTVRDAGLLKHSVTADWPGSGRGAVLAYDNFEATEAPLLLVAGSDAAGAAAAADRFAERYLAGIAAPTGFVFRAVPPQERIYPYTTPGQLATLDRVSVSAGRGEYESAQCLLTAYEDLRDIEVSCTELMHAETGKPIDMRYITHLRKRNGPLWIRWVNYAPLEPEHWEPGWTGQPDPLLERPERHLAAGRSLGLWLTFIVSENAVPGTYTATLACRANGRSLEVPVELTVWDFSVPREGLMGEPYMHLENLPPDNRRTLEDRHVIALVQNFVEHGMRVLHLGPPDLFQWHFSAEGAYRDVNLDWLEVSADGAVALDTSRYDTLIETADRAAAPFELRFMQYIQGLMGGYGDFRRALPHRFDDRPKRDGNRYQDHYSQEMTALFRQHLERKQWLDRFVLKVGDEPRGFDWWWENLAVGAREAGMPFMTCFNSIDWSAAEKGLGKVALWQPLYMHHNPEFFARARAAGGLISWYNCGPPPAIKIYTPLAEIRAYLWQAAKADLDIVCWWGIQCWQGHHDVWYSRYSHHNSLVYPRHPQKPAWMSKGKGWRDTEPIDSIRWEMIREGMEDARYVNLLRRLTAEARAQGRTEQADRARATLERIWDEVFPTLNDYRPEYETIMRCRRQVAEAILALKE